MKNPAHEKTPAGVPGRKGETPASYTGKRRSKSLIHVGRCPHCGKPAIRHKGREHCLHCDGEPLLAGLRGGA